MAYTDADGYHSILALVEDLEGIERVWFGAVAPHGFTSESYPLVWIRPVKWEQDDEVDPREPVRSVSFEVAIMAKGQGGYGTFTILDQLAELLILAIEGNGLEGALPARSRISGGRMEAANQVEALILSGEFAYLRDQTA